jgi:hypothetical protein
MKIERKEIIRRIVFENGLDLEVGDEFEDGRVFSIEEEGDGFNVICFEGEEGWNVFVNKDGELED